MKKILLISSLLLFIAAQPTSQLHAAPGANGKTVSIEESTSPPASTKQLRKQRKWKKRMERFQQKMEKKLERLRKKGNLEASFNLGFLGVIVMVVGGLFILLGVVIPVVGLLFLVLGIIIAFVGLLMLLLLQGIKVDSSN